MNRNIVFALLLLPGLAQAVICKTVGTDGVISFTNVPGSECPSGESVEIFVPPTATSERAERLVEGAAGSQAEFAGYESIRIESPEDGATIRSNDGRVTVRVVLEPGLQPFHFITAYLDGIAHQGSYGSSEVLLANVDRGTHRLYVTVKDSKGKTLIKSDAISFTLQRVGQELDLIVNPITGDDYVRRPDYPNGGVLDTLPVRGLYGGGGAGKTLVFLRFPVRQVVTKAVPVESKQTITYTIVTADGRREEVTETYNWEIEVPREWLESEASFEAVARFSPGGNVIASEVKTTSTHSVDPAFWRPLPADFTTTPGETNPAYPGVSTTPGETNPAFPGVPTTPGQTNPAFPGIPTTPGRTNPVFTP